MSFSPFLLNATLRQNTSKYALCDPEFVKKFLEALYVDDLSTGDRNMEETYQLCLKSKLRMLEAGFNMRKWSSNSKELIEKIKASEYGRGVEPINRLSKLEEDEETYATTSVTNSCNTLLEQHRNYI